MIYPVSYLLDQFLNMVFGFGAIGLCMVLGVVIATQSWRMINGRLDAFKLPSTKLVFIASILTLWSLVAAYLAPSCGLSTKGLLSIALAWAVFILWPALDFQKIVSDIRISNFILIVSAIFLIAQIIGWGPLSNFWAFNKPSGLFTEPSHVAMYLLPLISYRLFENHKDFLVLGLICLIWIFFNSATFMVGIILILFVIGLKKFIHSQNKVRFIALGAMLITLVMGSIIFGYINISILTDRIYAIFLLIHGSDPRGILNASAIVWLNGWSQAYETLMMTRGLGLGFNQMGCGDFVNIGRFSDHIRLWTGVVLNWNDGSFMGTKLISELGVAGFGLAVFLLAKSFHAIFSYLIAKENAISFNSRVCAMHASGAICMLILLLIRANGYFMEAVILCLSLLFFLNNAKNLSRGD